MLVCGLYEEMKGVQGQLVERNQEGFFHKDNCSRKPYIPHSLIVYPIALRKSLPGVNQFGAVSNQFWIISDSINGEPVTNELILNFQTLI